jgi:hypothetical protein
MRKTIAVIIVSLALLINGCFMRLPDIGQNEFSYLIGQKFKTPVVLYIAPVPDGDILAQKVPAGKNWKIVPAGTEVVVVATATRRLPPGLLHFATCKFEVGGKKHKADVPISGYNGGLDKAYIERIISNGK